MMVWVEGVVECLCWGETNKKKKKQKKGKGGQRFNFLADMFSWIGKVVVWRDETKPPCPHRKNWRRKRRKRKVHSSNQSTTGQGAQITDRSQTDNTHTESRHRN